jgi:hypothetical protein
MSHGAWRASTTSAAEAAVGDPCDRRWRVWPAVYYACPVRWVLSASLIAQPRR